MKKNLIHALYLVAYILAYGFWFLMSLLPLRFLYELSAFLYLIVTHVIRYRNHVIWMNMSASFPETSVEELRKI